MSPVVVVVVVREGIGTMELVVHVQLDNVTHAAHDPPHSCRGQVAQCIHRHSIYVCSCCSPCVKIWGWVRIWSPGRDLPRHISWCHDPQPLAHSLPPRHFVALQGATLNYLLFAEDLPEPSQMAQETAQETAPQASRAEKSPCPSALFPQDSFVRSEAVGSCSC